MSDVKFSLRLSLILFLIATLILALFYVNLSTAAELIGYLYIGAAALIGIVYIIMIGFRWIAKKIDTSTAVKCTGIIGLNLPVAFVYFYMVLQLMNTARVTFVNSTGKDITQVSIGGCSNIDLKDLHQGESRTVWIKIRSGCSVVLFYKMDREPKLERPIAYVSQMGGLVGTYYIGSTEKGLVVH